jgi:8-oxo-dGTP pyrophosphatase MutT (NUDIX family)
MPATLAGRIGTDYQPLWVAGARLGHLRRDVARALADGPWFTPRGADLALRDEGFTPLRRSRLLQRLARRLHELGLIADWRDERCAVLDAKGREIGRCERGAFRTLGLQNRAVHVNGCLPDGRLWIARRSAGKKSDPGMLDNMAAGGVCAGESLQQCAQRELWEEAGVARRLAAGVSFPGETVHSLRETTFGLHDELVVVAELQVPEDFVPFARDGEVAEFLRMTPGEARAALECGEFTIEAALALRAHLARAA